MESLTRTQPAHNHTGSENYLERPYGVTRMQAPLVFPARSPNIGLISSGLILAAATALVVVVIRYLPPKSPLQWLPLALMLGFGAVVVSFAAILPTMKYVIDSSRLILRCGPFHWEITLADIHAIVERNLSWLPWSEGWKLPGYALFKIEYGDVGQVRMCATRLTKRILVIKAGNELWGVTPADVEGFVEALRRSRGE